MRSIRRNMRLITAMLTLFMAGMGALVFRIYSQSSFYMSNSDSVSLGKVYDRNGDVLFDQNADPETYGYGHFTDVANFIGNDSGQMTNTLVSENMQYLSNYSFSAGLRNENGSSSIVTTLDHAANQRVYDAFGDKNGTAIAYNYLTGEVLVCVSRPGLDPFGGYTGLEEGSLLCKAFYKFTPGSTQKILTTAAACETMGADKLDSKRYRCDGAFTNRSGKEIICHFLSGHGEQNIHEAFANSCNPFYAQLVEDGDFVMNNVMKVFRDLGYSVNGSKAMTLEINGINVETASTVLNDKGDFSTEWGFIGQGETMISPCMLMMWQSAVATEKGFSVLPYVISSTTDVVGNRNDMKSPGHSKQFFSASTASYMREIMISNGSRYSDSIPGYVLGLKSGTAQVKNGDEENSFLVGFNTDTEKPIAFCVLIENKDQWGITTDSIVSVLLDSL
ncbi:penicillin-binding transpeptidase domain-containing protein [Ruminococcus sp. HUN007]|uniref:penicillin-binding transpeptidase domain-containing protein n=1 Tax=Ruminococcus sp. HUN007 TaxID=1514668 RepID=UPI0005D2239C|nr:penicillin-binding transpeptidase domain-containing protein [Ruminococcus sp. HUN007]